MDPVIGTALAGSLRIGYDLAAAALVFFIIRAMVK
jgi:hypothetical protein